MNPHELTEEKGEEKKKLENGRGVEGQMDYLHATDDIFSIMMTVYYYDYSTAQL